MSEFNKSTSRDSRTNDLASIPKAKDISKWNELFCILLNFPNYPAWNIVILLTVVLNYILVTINLTHAPDEVYSFIFFYAASDILYLTNFILLLLHRVWNVAKTDFQYTVETSVLVLILDFISILPQTALFVTIFETRYSFFVPYFRIITMMRLYNLFSMRRKLGIFQRNRFRWILIQYSLTLVIFVHTTNFVWFFIECSSENCPKQLYKGEFQKTSFGDWTEWYFHHFFASIQILLNVRFGDILPKNFYELYLFIIIIILGHGLSVWFISNFTWYLMNVNHDKAFFSQKVADIKRYVEETDDDTKTKTVKYYSTMWKHRGKMNQPSFLATLPPSLRTDLIHDMNCGLLYRSVLLKDLPELVLRKISLNMKSIYLLADEVIYSQCVVKTCMVCIENGTLEILNDEDEESRVIAFTPGTIIGESALFLNVPSKATVRAVEYTELKILEKKDFLNLMTHFPHIMRSLKYEIEKRMTDSFTDKNPSKNFSLPNLKRLKVKLQRVANDEQKTSSGGEYPHLYKIEKGKSLGNKQNGLSLMKSWRFLYSSSQAIFCLMYSFEVIFKRANSNRFEVFGILMDILCFVDIVLQTTTSRVPHKNIMTSLVKTIDQRLDDWKYNLDIYSLFPMELWSHFIEQPLVRNRLYDLFKLNRLLRLHRINEIVQYFESDVRGRYYIGWIFKILLYGFLFYYSSACIIHLISCPYETCEDGSWYQPSRRNDSTYSTVNSIYFAMMLSFSTGIDGFLSNSYYGIAILITILMTLVFLKNYALGMIISAVFLENFHGKQQKLRFFLKRFFVFYRMSPLSYQRLSKIFRIDPYFSEGSTKMFIEETAPHYTLMLLQTSKIKNTLSEIPLFLMVDTYFLTFIEKHAKILKVPNNEIVYSFGDLTRQMFVIQKGFCHVYNSEDSLERTVGHGTQLGVLEMLFCIPKRHTVVTCTDCVIICLEYTTFRQILELFPKEKITMEDLVLDEGFLTRLKKTKTDEEFDDDYEIRSHILPEQKCFISLTKTWPNYCELYREKLGIFWFCAVLLMPVSVHPEGFFLVLWCVTRCILIVILGILEPIMILAPAFADGLYWWKVICHSSLYFDIYILMHVAYYDGRGFLKIHPAHTFWYYFCHGFFLDLLAAVPWELLMIHLSPDNHGMADKPPHFHHCSWGLLKLTQFYKVFKCLTFLDENIFASVKSMKIAKILLAIVLVINISTSLGINYICQTQYRIPSGLHFFDESYINVNYLQCQGSFWQENSSLGILHQEPLEKYMVGLYTVVNLMTQTGIDDTTTRTFEPRIGAVILTFIGFMLFTILTAILSILILEGFVETSENPEDVFRLMSIFQSKGLKNNIRRKCFRHFEFIWRHNGASSHQVIKKLHPELDVNNTLFYFYKSILQDVPLFINYDTNFLGVIVDYIFVKQFVKGEIIVKCKDLLSDIYIVAKGEVDILNKNDECMQTIGPTGVFGNISDNYNILSEIQVVAKKNVELWTLKTEKLLILINIYSVVVDELEHVLKNKPNFIPPIILNGADIPNELESDFDPVVRKSSILLMKYKSFQFCLPQKWFKFSLEYDHGIFKFVDTTTAIASILNLLTIPYVFVTQERGLFGYLYLVFEPIFYLRIFFKLHRSYVNVYGNLIQSNKKLCKKYINSPMQLFWDVVPNFPIGLMCFIFPREEWFFSYSCLRLLHILRFYYVSQYFECNSELHRKMWLLLLKLVLYNVLIIHILACIWFMLACPFDNCNTDSWISGFEEHLLDMPVFYRMAMSYYYVLTVLTTTGIGDIRSTNILELLFTSITMFMGKIMLAILIGSVLRTLHQSEIRLTRYQKQLRNCLEYLKEQDVPAYQMRRTRTYMENIWRYSKGNEPIKLLDLLPNPLKQDSLAFIYGSQLRDTFLFKDIDEALLREICSKLEKKVYFRDDYIVKHGDVDFTMYFIYQGNVSVLTKYSYLSEIFHVMLHPKDLFGVSQGLNLEKYHTFYYRASSKEVEILTLKFDDWSYLLSLFPKDHQQIFSKVEKEYLQ